MTRSLYIDAKLASKYRHLLRRRFRSGKAIVSEDKVLSLILATDFLRGVKTINAILGKAWGCLVDGGLSARQHQKPMPTWCILLAPTAQLPSVPTYHYDMLVLLLVAGQSPRTLPREAPTVSAHSSAGNVAMLYHIRATSNPGPVRAVLNPPFMSTISVSSFLPRYYHVVPIHSLCFPGCWPGIVQCLSESFQHQPYRAQSYTAGYVHTVHRICTSCVL